MDASGVLKPLCPHRFWCQKCFRNAWLLILHDHDEVFHLVHVSGGHIQAEVVFVCECEDLSVMSKFTHEALRMMHRVLFYQLFVLVPNAGQEHDMDLETMGRVTWSANWDGHLVFAVVLFH